LIEFVAVIAVTAVAVFAMINLKDLVNRSEAMRAMEHLGQKVVQYRQVHGSIPGESWVDMQKQSLAGHVRLGQLQYRGLWIDFESPPDSILAYSEKKYGSLLVGNGYVVLRLGGRVEWLEKQEFEKLLVEQQGRDEAKVLQEQRHDEPVAIPPLWRR